ncbi:MAG: protease-like activity factor CPAF [Chlamydiia bacterium]|nr:protease-like activity factor CPAF [Chlamydiia bacterium]
MKFPLRSYILGSCLAFASSLAAMDFAELQAEAIRDLDTIETFFYHCYAPYQWKEQTYAWTIERAIADAKEEVLAAESLTVKDCQQLIQRVFASTMDYHVGVLFSASERANLPFSVMAIDGHYYLSHIDRTRLSTLGFPFEVGDEVLEFDGRPVAELVDELRARYMAGGDSPTDHRIAEFMLTSRSGRSGHSVPKGTVVLTVQTQEGQRLQQQCVWDYRPETLPILRPARAVNEGSLSERLESFWQLNPHQVYAQDSVLPDLGTPILRTSPKYGFTVSVFQTPERKMIGLLRLPNYSDWSGADMAQAIERLEELTDGLVIDQVNSGGGNAMKCYALASMFAEDAMVTPRHRLILNSDIVDMAQFILEFVEDLSTEEEVREALGDDLGGYPVTYQTGQMLLEFARFILDEWSAGHYLTEPTHILAIDRIHRHPTARYTKPVLVLANEKSFSCADFFPEIMQSSGRVRVMGTQTAGAGGAVFGYSFPNRLGIQSFYLTGTIAERADKTPLENSGVKPDVEYKVTVEDLREGFKPFADAVLAELLSMIK